LSSPIRVMWSFVNGRHLPGFLVQRVAPPCRACSCFYEGSPGRPCNRCGATTPQRPNADAPSWRQTRAGGGRAA
jgi:hypothetical protein